MISKDGLQTWQIVATEKGIEKIHCGFPHTNIFDLKLESIPLMLIDSNGELLLFIDAKSFNKINLLCVYRINLFCGFAHVSHVGISMKQKSPSGKQSLKTTKRL